MANANKETEDQLVTKLDEIATTGKEKSQMLDHANENQTPSNEALESLKVDLKEKFGWLKDRFDDNISNRGETHRSANEDRDDRLRELQAQIDEVQEEYDDAVEDAEDEYEEAAVDLNEKRETLFEELEEIFSPEELEEFESELDEAIDLATDEAEEFFEPDFEWPVVNCNWF